jgi:uncharacterized protein (TIGR00369 family)
MKKLNPEHKKAMLPLIHRGPFVDLLSMRVVDFDEGHALLEIDLGRKHQNPFGTLHGGVHAAAIDTAAYWASYSILPEDTGLITIDLIINNIAVTKRQKIIVEGNVIKSGKRLYLSEAIVRDDEGRLLAQGTTKQMVTPDLQSIENAAKALGFPPLPPKFLPEE